jgi:hypothetical protein
MSAAEFRGIFDSRIEFCHLLFGIVLLGEISTEDREIRYRAAHLLVLLIFEGSDDGLC